MSQHQDKETMQQQCAPSHGDNGSEEFIPVDEVNKASESSASDSMIMDDKQVDSDENDAIYERKIPKALIELKKIFSDDFDFEVLKNTYGLSKNEALAEGIEKVIVQEGEGLEAKPGSIIRCK